VPVLRRWRVFPGQASQLSVVRRWLASFLPDCPARDDLTSVATELASNAIRHTGSGQGGNFAVQIAWRQQEIRVAVSDGGASEGPRLIADADGEHGRGLLLVRALAIRADFSGDHRGRVVWADLPWDSPAGPRSG
jgi:serine/threonine-protein kinase RsbW